MNYDDKSNYGKVNNNSNDFVWILYKKKLS